MSDSRREGQILGNAAFWRTGTAVDEYATRTLRPAEALILARHVVGRHRVLELGCGAGRVLGYLVQLGGEIHGIDISDAMVDRCRALYPSAHLQVGDIGGLTGCLTGHFDAILAPDNVLGGFDDEARRGVISDIRDLLAPRGLLVFSAHNLDVVNSTQQGNHVITPERRGLPQWLALVAERPPLELLGMLPRIPRRLRNRKRLRPLEYRGSDHALLNDLAHDYALLHYYITRDGQEQQLAELGFELHEVLDLDGWPVKPGQPGRTTSLYYVASRVG